ncbi:MAG: NAD(P)/FAD-dependent oxidoreductase [Lachnospiraceae bacterium]|nr:NAD(P)/FAD-dependent oxidoreductase [Lachnospiraceae bacterium]
MYDTAIIGTGPAGLSAAINLKLHNKEILWFGSKDFSVKVAKSEKIANYPGMGLISGADLNAKFEEHRKAMDLAITDQMVTSISVMKKKFMLSAGSDVYTAKTILLTTGTATGKGFEGEDTYLGSGVSYCATCDGFLYKGKTIAVYCQDVRFEHEVDYLAEITDKVYLSAPYKGGKYGKDGSAWAAAEEPASSGEPVSAAAGKIERLSSAIKKVSGTMKLSSIELADGTVIETEALFCLRNAIAPTTLLKKIELDGPHVVVGRDMATNIPGCFAAGDCTGRPYQIAKCVGEGNIAAHSIIEYLAAME